MSRSTVPFDPTRPLPPGVRRSWLRMRAVSRRNAYVLLREPHRLFDVTLWPLVDVLMFGALATFVGRGGANGGQQAAGYLLAGIILWHVVYQSQIAVSTGFLEETWTRNLLNLMVTPIRESEYVGGVVLFGIAKLVMGVGLMAIGAFVFFSFNVGSIGLAIIPIATVLLIVGWAISLLVIAFVLRFGHGAEALAWGVMFVLMPLSGIFYPIDALPRFIRPIALALPTTYAFKALRGVVDGQPLDWGFVAIGAVGAVVLSVFATWFLIRMLRLFRRRGYVTRYS